MRPVLLPTVLCLLPALAGCGNEEGQDSRETAANEMLAPGGSMDIDNPAVVAPILPTDSINREACDNQGPFAPCVDEPGTTGATVLKGTILGAEGLLCDGEVLIDGGPANQSGDETPGEILCVSESCADHPRYEGATRICAPIVLPGLIDAHNHMSYNTLPAWMSSDRSFTHRDQWRGSVGGDLYDARPPRNDPVAARYNEIRLLMGGVTAVHKSERVRACYDHVRNLDRGPDAHGLGYQDDDFTECVFPLDSCRDTPNYSQGRDVPARAYAAHVAEGTDEEARAEFDQFVNDGQLGPNTAVIHCVACKGPELSTLREADAHLIWSPRSNTNLYGVTTDVNAALNLGVSVAMGSDWTPSGSLTMLDELACAREISDQYLDSSLTGRALFLMATHHAADAMGVGDFIGRLAPGKVADITVLHGDRNQPYTAVTKARPQDVRAVFIGGSLYYGDSSIFDPTIARNDFCEAVDVCGIDKTLCLRDEGEIASSLEKDQWPQFNLNEMQTYLENVLAQNALDNPSNPAYAFELAPLFSCEAPEPCRLGNTRFSGTPTAEDPDADGLLGDGDNCVNIFNPDQGDLDGDGKGDSCDQCPLLANSDACDPRGPLDTDMDGIEDSLDLCPNVADPMQGDRDADGLGDACDPCPELVSSQACPIQIAVLKSSSSLPRGLFSVNGIVTAVFPQDHPSLSGSFVIQNENAAVNAPYEAIFVYMRDGAMDLARPQVSDRVTVDGQVNDYSGQKQLSLIQNITIDDPGVYPTPSALSIAETSIRFDELEASIACLSNLTVTGVQEDTDDERRGGFTVREQTGDGEFFIGESLFKNEVAAVVDDTFRQICGILFRRSGQAQLLPRQASDMERGMPVVRSVSPSTTFLRAGRSEVPKSAFGEPLTLRLDRPAEVGGLEVSATTSGPNIRVGETIVIDAGQIDAQIRVEAVSANVGNTIMLRTEAQRNGLEATIDVYAENADASRISFDESRYVVPPNSMVTIGLRFDAPLLNQLNLSTNLTDIEGLSGPSIITLAADSLGTRIPVQTGPNEGSGVLEVRAGLIAGSIEIQISDQPAQLMINEVNYDIEGEESLEFVELYNGGGQPAPLSDVILELVNGANGEIYGTVDLAPFGQFLHPGQYLVVGDADVAATVPETGFFLGWTSRGDGHDLQNGPDGIRIVAGPSVLDSVAYGGNGLDFQEGLRGAPEDSGRGEERSISRCPNGSDQDDNGSDFMLTVPSPGAPNICP